MDMKESDSKRNSAMLNVSNKKHSQLSLSSNGSVGNEQMALRRPFGVAAIDLTPIIRKPEDFKNNLDLPFILCEKENLDNTLKKLLMNKDVGKIDSKLAVSVELLHGDIKQVQEWPKEKVRCISHFLFLFINLSWNPFISIAGDCTALYHLSKLWAFLECNNCFAYSQTDKINLLWTLFVYLQTLKCCMMNEIAPSHVPAQHKQAYQSGYISRVGRCKISE